MNTLAFEASNRVATSPCQRERRAASVTVILAGALLATAIMSAGMGAVPIDPSLIPLILLERAGLDLGGAHTPIQSAVLIDVRMPRVVVAVLVGVAMATAGAAMQALFRNPLADPGIVGVSSGAALGAVSWIVLAGSFAPFAVVASVLGHHAQAAAAFFGGLVASLVIYRLARSAIADGQTFMLLLAGIAFSALAGAVTGLLTFIADDQQLRSITFWSMGSLGGVGWEEIGVLLLFLLPAMSALAILSRVLDALLLGETVAGHLGFDMNRMRPTLIVCVAILVGTSVAMTGMIGFVGLMAPHIGRLLVGPGHRALLPASAMLGALLLLAADMFARTVAAPAEVPIGLITALIGGPFFLALLYKRFGVR